MKLHARSVAAAANVPEEQFNDVVAAMIESGDIKSWRAQELVSRHSNSADVHLDNAATGEACGKVILLGEHAVVYDRNALALPLPAAVTAQVAERESGTTLSIPAWSIREDWKTVDAAPDGAAAVVALIMRELGVGVSTSTYPQGFRSVSGSDPPRRLRLRSSGPLFPCSS